MGNDGDKSVSGSAPTANAEQITTALQSAVQKQFKIDGNVIPSVMRARVEEELGLGEGFFKSDPHWKSVCKAIIKAEFEALADAAEAEEALSPKKKPVKKPVTKKAAVTKPPAKGAAAKKTKKEESVNGGDNNTITIGKQEDKDEIPKKPAARRGKATPKKNISNKAIPKRARVKPTVEDEEDEAEGAGSAQAPAPAPVADDISEPDESPPKKKVRATSNPDSKDPMLKRSKVNPVVKESSGVGEDVSELPPPAATMIPSDSELSDIDDEPPQKKPRKRSSSNSGVGVKSASPEKKAKESPKSTPKGEQKGSAEEPNALERPTALVTNDAGSDSEMSVVLDPTPQKSRSGATKKVPAPKKTKNPKAPQGRKSKAKKVDKPKEDTPLDPEQEQLKNLKAWLLKCGVRKIWSRELAKFDTPRAQIMHLKSLLADIGMAGRYSAEKAKKIKEERELRAEVEAVQLGASEWGHEEKSGERKVSTRSMRNVPVAKAVTEKKEIRGMEEFAFLGDQSDSD